MSSGYYDGTETTIDPDNYTTLEDQSYKDCSSPTSYTSNVIITAFIALFLILGVAGNTLTLCVILKNKALRTTFNLFLISLCASDLVSALICSPLWLYRRTWGFSQWNWGIGLCKFYWVVDFATDYATAMHILSFCLMRFVAVKYPFSSLASKFTKKYIIIYIACLWAVCFVVASPHAFFMDVREGDSDQWPSCSIVQVSREKYHLYSVIIYPIFFYVPEILIVILSFLISRTLLNTPRQAEDDSRPPEIPVTERNIKACTQLKLISACFTIGYIPLAAYLIWTSASAPDCCNCHSIALDYWFGVVSYLTLRMSECLNPVMYNLGCMEMRNASFNFIKHSLCRIRT